MELKSKLLTLFVVLSAAALFSGCIGTKDDTYVPLIDFSISGTVYDTEGNPLREIQIVIQDSTEGAPRPGNFVNDTVYADGAGYYEALYQGYGFWSGYVLYANDVTDLGYADTSVYATVKPTDIKYDETGKFVISASITKDIYMRRLPTPPIGTAEENGATSTEE